MRIPLHRAQDSVAGRAPSAADLPVSRVVVVTQRLPWPTRRGGDLRAANVLGALVGLGLEVGVVALARPDLPADVPEGLSLWLPDKDNDEEGLARALDWVRAADGHPSDRWWTAQAAVALERAIKRLDPQLVIIEHLWTRRALELGVTANRRTVLCAHNVEGALHTELAGSADRRAPAALAILVAERTSTTEAAAVRLVDQVWACSANDASEFRERYPGCAPVMVVPNTVALPAPHRSATNLTRPLLLFIGALGYPPNAQAALWLAVQLLPALHAVGLDARLRVVGANPPPSLLDLAGEEQIEVTGFVADLAPHLREAAVMPIHLMEGGGTRFKVLEAFAAGIPVVSTLKGVEGIEAAAGEHYLRAETVGEFVAAITKVCASQELRTRLAGRARTLVEESYAAGSMQAAIRAALAALGEFPRAAA